MKDILIGISLLWLLPWSFIVTKYIFDKENDKK